MQVRALPLPLRKRAGGDGKIQAHDNCMVPHSSGSLVSGALDFQPKNHYARVERQLFRRTKARFYTVLT